MRPELLLVVLGAALVGYASLVAARRLVPRRPGLVALAAACLGWAQVVAVAQLLSLWGALRPGPLLAVHAGVALVAALVSRRRRARDCPPGAGSRASTAAFAAAAPSTSPSPRWSPSARW